MEGNLHRFRLGKANDLPKIKRKRGAEATSCSRCRTMKRKCVKLADGCRLCEGAGAHCSLLGAEVTREVEVEQRPAGVLEMASWLSVCLNDSIPEDESSGEHGYAPSRSRKEDVSVEEFLELPKISGSVEVLTRQWRATPLPSVLGNRNNTSATNNPTSHQLVQSPNSSRTPKPPAGKELVDAYFRHVHRSYPFVDRAAVIEEVDSNLSNGFENMSQKLYLIMAIGSTTLRRIGHVSDDTCARFEVRGHIILQDCLSRNDLASMEELLLLALYSFFDPTGIAPYILTGILARQATAMGLTRESSDNHPLALAQIEARRRLYWSIYSLDRVVSLSVGLPFGLADSHTNIRLPAISLEEYASIDRDHFTVTLQVNRHIIALRQLESTILERIHFVNPTSLIHPELNLRAITADIRTNIEDWYTQGCLVNPLDRDDIPFHNTIPWLNCRYQNLLLLLYMPSSLNHSISSRHLQSLQSAASKYIQLSKVLSRQKHLPLNWVTLCRLVAVCPILLYTFVRCKSESADMTLIRETVTACAEILAAFNVRWILATTATVLYRDIETFLDKWKSKTVNSVESLRFYDRTKLDAVIVAARELIEILMGSASIYCGVLDATLHCLSEDRR